MAGDRLLDEITFPYRIKWATSGPRDTTMIDASDSNGTDENKKASATTDP